MKVNGWFVRVEVLLVADDRDGEEMCNAHVHVGDEIGRSSGGVNR